MYVVCRRRSRRWCMLRFGKLRDASQCCDQGWDCGVRRKKSEAVHCLHGGSPVQRRN